MIRIALALLALVVLVLQARASPAVQQQPFDGSRSEGANGLDIDATWQVSVASQYRASGT